MDCDLALAAVVALSGEVKLKGGCAIQKELKEIERDTISGVSVDVLGNSLQRLRGYVKGAICRNSSWQRGETNCIVITVISPASVSVQTEIHAQPVKQGCQGRGQVAQIPTAPPLHEYFCAQRPPGPWLQPVF